ncbi:hypothetical protein [Nocardioides sp. Iso805N]|uniref:hypothetical protein n=1 Tax=Nocardioides sp. Iso805N TaxID=1283287 RepID=UPI0018DEE55F|nr:hypothetical protein [Nocardioides sp. Iso805N]
MPLERKHPTWQVPVGCSVAFPQSHAVCVTRLAPGVPDREAPQTMPFCARPFLRRRWGYPVAMKQVRVGLVADPAKPTVVARRFRDLDAADGDRQAWDVEVVSEAFTLACEDTGTALSRLTDHAREHRWDLVIGVTELPLRDGEGRYLLIETDPQQRAAVMSLPALGGLRMHQRSGDALGELISGMADPTSTSDRRVRLPHGSARARLLLGMVLANRPWLLLPGLKSALVAALTTGAIATINSTVWLLAGSLSWWRLIIATIASMALVVGWLVIDGELWDVPEDDSPEARDRSRLYNTSTLLTLATGVVICYVALYVLDLAWALFVLDPTVMGRYLQTSRNYGDLFVLAWFVASVATVGGALGSGLESDEAIRAAAYSKREEDRRSRLAHDRRVTDRDS